MSIAAQRLYSTVWAEPWLSSVMVVSFRNSLSLLNSLHPDAFTVDFSIKEPDILQHSCSPFAPIIQQRFFMYIQLHVVRSRDHDTPPNIDWTLWTLKRCVAANTA